MLLLAARGLAGCQPPGSAPDATPSCARAYQATVDALAAMFESAGAARPAFPPREAYVERCSALGLDAEQLACLEPAAAIAAPETCASALAPARPGIDALAAWFADGVQPAPSDATPGARP